MACDVILNWRKEVAIFWSPFDAALLAIKAVPRSAQQHPRVPGCNSSSSSVFISHQSSAHQKKLKKTCRSPSPPRRHRRRARDSEDWVETARIWGFGRSTNGGCSKSKSFSTYIFCILCFTLVHKTRMFTIFYLHHATSIHNHLEKFYISYMFLMCSFFVHLCGAKWQFAYCLPSSTGWFCCSSSSAPNTQPTEGWKQRTAASQGDMCKACWN